MMKFLVFVLFLFTFSEATGIREEKAQGFYEKDEEKALAFGVGSVSESITLYASGCIINMVTLNQKTTGTCNVLSCPSWRGPTNCMDGNCWCQRGHYTADGQKCIPCPAGGLSKTVCPAGREFDQAECMNLPNVDSRYKTGGRVATWAGIASGCFRNVLNVVYYNLKSPDTLYDPNHILLCKNAEGAAWDKYYPANPPMTEQVVGAYNQNRVVEKGVGQNYDSSHPDVDLTMTYNQYDINWGVGGQAVGAYDDNRVVEKGVGGVEPDSSTPQGDYQFNYNQYDINWGVGGQAVGAYDDNHRESEVRQVAPSGQMFVLDHYNYIVYPLAAIGALSLVHFAFSQFQKEYKQFPAITDKHVEQV